MKLLWIYFLFTLGSGEVSTWCPAQDHDHKSGFRVGQWLKKNGMYQRARICKKRDCKFYQAKQIQYKNGL